MLIKFSTCGKVEGSYPHVDKVFHMWKTKMGCGKLYPQGLWKTCGKVLGVFHMWKSCGKICGKLMTTFVMLNSGRHDHRRPGLIILYTRLPVLFFIGLKDFKQTRGWVSGENFFDYDVLELPRPFSIPITSNFGISHF